MAGSKEVTIRYCKECFIKQQRIDELEGEMARLKAKLRYQERTAKEGFFGSSTPSSKLPVKSNTLEERTERRGGGRKGHKGHGRSSICAEEADRIEHVAVEGTCPDCGTPLNDKGTRVRTVIDCEPVRMKRILYHLERKRCPKCKKVISARAPGVLPKSLYGNQLLAHVAAQHYLHGDTLGQIERQTGVGYSSLVDAMHQLARRLKNVHGVLIQAYRKAPVKHADETGWRTDGRNGYSWLFCTPDLSIFRICKTRSSRIVREVLGEEPLQGVLVVDRYSGYNKAPCSIQYCYAHLLRAVKDLEKQFPGNAEIKTFVDELSRQLANAISLRRLDITDRQFEKQAAQTKRKIIDITRRQARHPAIQKIQDIFRGNAGRLYHWAEDRNVPADNNLAERELRPLVVARKVSFGSQSYEGSKTREILMTVLRTLNKRTSDVADTLKAALDKLAEEPQLHPHKLLFPNDTS